LLSIECIDVALDRITSLRNELEYLRKETSVEGGSAVAKPYTCIDCNNDFTYDWGRKPKRCPGCREENNRKLARERNRRYDAREKGIDAPWCKRKLINEACLPVFEEKAKCPICGVIHTIQVSIRSIVMPRVYCDQHKFIRTISVIDHAEIGVAHFPSQIRR
jgi:predicted Zn-ribbon and HTH transcriptional regulator